MNLTKDVNSIALIGDMKLNGTNIATTGTFASFSHYITIQNTQLIMAEILGRNFTGVEINGEMKSPIYISGVILFQTESNVDTCLVEMRRGPSKLLCAT